MAHFSNTPPNWSYASHSLDNSVCLLFFFVVVFFFQKIGLDMYHLNEISKAIYGTIKKNTSKYHLHVKCSVSDFFCHFFVR